MTQSPSSRLNMALGQLITNEVLDKRVLDAMLAVPREAFVPEGLKGAAYADEDLDVGFHRFLMEPMVLARLLTARTPEANDNVLVIGAYPGYVPAVIAQLSSRVLGTEENDEMARSAQEHLQKLNLWHAKIAAVPNLPKGFAEEGPYDLIFINGAVEEIPQSLFSQLSEGGALLCVRCIARRPGQSSGLGKAMVLQREGGRITHRELFDASIPHLPPFSRREGFRF